MVSRTASIVLSTTLLGSLLIGPTPAKAWDPSTTHQRLTESIATGSGLHLHWMESTALEQGLFSTLNVDPARLGAQQTKTLVRLFERLHADSGAVALGGPGACPDASAPIDTQRYCVRGDLWQLSGLGWLRLGVFAESADPGRQLHHFAALGQSGADTWEARGTSKGKARRMLGGSHGQPGVGLITHSTFSGESRSAAAWLADEVDALAPKSTFRHLRSAALAESPEARVQARALALMGLGALLHVIQDLGLPEHARADLGAFGQRLSQGSGQDVGSALIEYARSHPGFVHNVLSDVNTRSTDDASPQAAPNSGAPWTERLIGVDAGLASWTAHHFLSPADLQHRINLADELSPEAAAQALLGEHHGLALEEAEGARLSAWPAQRGYLLSSTGRPLAAFARNSAGQVETYFDEVCHREVIAHALPRIVEVGRNVLEQLWPAFPKHELLGEAGSRRMALHTPAHWQDSVAHILIEDETGTRTRSAAFKLRRDGRRSALALPALTETSQRYVVVLTAHTNSGHPVTVEQYVSPAETTE